MFKFILSFTLFVNVIPLYTSGSVHFEEKDNKMYTCSPQGGNSSGPQGSGGSEQTDPAPAKGAGLQIPVVAPVDPNEIIGPQGYVDADSLRWVSTDATLGYTIYFENDPEFATA